MLAGGTAASLEPAGAQEHSGFETAVTVSGTGPYFAVTAHDANGRVLGRSPAVSLGK